MTLFKTVFTFALAVLALFTIAQPVPPAGPPVTITEIMYNPPEAGVDSLEFIEIRNPNPTNQRNVGGYSFTAGVEFTFPPNYILEPNAYVIVAVDSVAFTNTFGMSALQWTSGALSNNGEAVMLINNIGGVIDSVVYSNGAPWPTEADGNGTSLVLCTDTLDNSLVENWSASQNSVGIAVNGTPIFASPGADCSVPDGINSVSQSDVSIYPNPSNGTFRISYSGDVVNEKTTLRIYDLKGGLIVEQNLKLIEESTIQLPESSPNGTYIISLEGEKVNYRQPLIILE